MRSGVLVALVALEMSGGGGHLDISLGIDGTVCFFCIPNVE